MNLSRISTRAHCALSSSDSETREERERRDDFPALADSLHDFGDERGMVRPIAGGALRVEQHPRSVRMLGLGTEQVPIGGDRLVVALELAQRMRAAVQRFGIIGTRPKRLVVAGERLGGALEVDEGIAAILASFGIAPDRQRSRD